jgi:hypothetical protein
LSRLNLGLRYKSCGISSVVFIGESVPDLWVSGKWDVFRLNRDLGETASLKGGERLALGSIPIRNLFVLSRLRMR